MNDTWMERTSMVKGMTITVGVALAAALSLHTAASAHDDPVPNTGLGTIAPLSKYESLAQSMAATAATPADRLAAAKSLCEGLDAPLVAPGQIDAIASILRNQRGAFARTSILIPLAAAPELPEQLLPHLSWITASCEGEDLRNVLRAIGNIHTRDAAKVLLDFATTASTGSSSPSVHAGAFDGLIRLSGRSDLGTDATKWASWLADANAMDDRTWQLELARGQSRRAAESAVQQEVLEGKLLDSLRELHIATPVDKRDDLLARLLDDKDSAIRGLGFELTRREMSEGILIGPKATRSILSLLRDPSETARIDAALLVSQLAPKDAGPRLADAIEHEESPAVVNALLVAALAYADSLHASTLMKWIDVSGPHVPAAVDLGFAMLRAGQLEQTPDRERLLAAARKLIESGNSSWSVCHVLGLLGTDADQVLLLRLLQSGDREGKIAAGDVLSVSPEFVDPIAMTARNDPELFDIATRAFVLHRQDLASFRTLASLPAPDPELRRRNLLMFAGMCPATDVLTAAKSLNVEPVFLEGLLASLTSENRILSERADPKQLKAIAEGILWLAKIRLDLKKPDSALAAIAALPEIEEVVTDLGVLTRTRLEAWVCLGRTDEAIKLDALLEDWMAALKRCPMENQFAETISLLDAKYKLTPEQKTAIEALAPKH